jgi:hypothetical protein
MCQIPDRMDRFRIDDYEPREREGGGRHGHTEGVADFLEDLRFSTRDSANVFETGGVKIQGPVGLFS